MKTKIGTVLDAALVRRARSAAARQGKRFNQVLEEALAQYLEAKAAGVRAGVVARTAGSFKLGRDRVERILRDEPGILDG
jgi:hypothetical protein